MKKALNVKNMLEATRRAVDDDELEEIRNSFNTMYNLGFVTDDEFDKYISIVDHWTINDEGDIEDWETGEVVVRRS